jgi:hypothetical protein
MSNAELARRGLQKEFVIMSVEEAYLAVPSNNKEVDSKTNKSRNSESG